MKYSAVHVENERIGSARAFAARTLGLDPEYLFHREDTTGALASQKVVFYTPDQRGIIVEFDNFLPVKAYVDGSRAE